MHIVDYLQHSPMVKLEAELAQLVYEQFKAFYDKADEYSKQTLEDEMNRHIPTGQQIKGYLVHRSIYLHYINTLANFFDLTYTINNHNPADHFSFQPQTETLI